MRSLSSTNPLELHPARRGGWHSTGDQVVCSRSIPHEVANILLSPTTTGLLVVDMQNGFCDIDGDLGRRGQGAPLRAVVPNVLALVDIAHAARIPVFFSRQEHFLEDVTRDRHKFATHVQKQHHLPCLRGTRDAELIDPLKGRIWADDYVFTKHRSSCFYGTTLEVALRLRGLDTLIVCGVTSNYCVESTIRDAYARDLDVLVVTDCCAGLHKDLHHAMIRNVELYFGQAMLLEQVRNVLEPVGSGA